ncbi:hypothetical protein KI387_023409, partial [Taxus chinensis]
RPAEVAGSAGAYLFWLIATMEGAKLNGIRVLTKEGQNGKSCMALYYAASPAAVPFEWESEPGTPKHLLNLVSCPGHLLNLEEEPGTPIDTPPRVLADSFSPSFVSDSSSNSTLISAGKVSPSKMPHKLSGVLYFMKSKLKFVRPHKS